MKTIITKLVLLSLITAFGCSKKSSIPVNHDTEALSANDEFFLHPEEVTLYNTNQANAKKIKDCAFAVEEKNSCAVSDSPLLGIGKEKITVTDILNRTMASQASYIATFRNILSSMPSESLQMFGSVNAIVISERIVPSFYHYGSGAIYLSSSYFWKTREEKALIKSKDYRADFGNELLFSDSTDYIKNGVSMYGATTIPRSESVIAPQLIRLLYHELAHANDFFPKSYYSSPIMDKSASYYKVTNDRWDNERIISQKMNTTLASNLLHKIGSVLYQGEKADQEVLSTTGHAIADEFKNDVAADMYGYSTPREDFAMLVEQSMFYHHYKYSAYTVFIKYPHTNFKIPQDYDYPIAGGIKNKIADPKVKERAQFALDKIFDLDYSQRIIGSLDQIRAVDIPEDTEWSDVYNL